jgi:anti-sigma-K factor RskA
MPYKFEHHPDEESFDLYAFGQLAESRTEVFEEHLLICQDCRTRLDATEQYLKTMARGSLLLRQQSRPSFQTQLAQWFDQARNLGSFSISGTSWAAAALAVCAILFFSTASLRNHQPVLQPIAVSLLANRGAAQTVPANHPLLLHLDARGLAQDARGLAQNANLQIRLADASGNKVYEHTGIPGDSVEFKIATPLQPGTYYVRILKPDSQEIAREFALEVR